jgi:TetR/AcrR family tetracycline transcriptional repressor
VALTREDIVEAALAVLDEAGLEGLTLRRIADRLGVKAPALYWHVASKKELVDEVATELMRRAQVTDPLTGDWRTELGAAARRLRAVLLRHADGARVFSGTRLTDIEVIRGREGLLRLLVEAGFELRDAALAWSTVRDLVVGFVIEEQEVYGPDGVPRPGYDPLLRAEAVGADHPLTARSGPAAWGTAGERFAEALRFVLDGMAARLPR